MLSFQALLFVAMFVLNSVVVTLLFWKTKCFRGATLRNFRIAAWIFPLVAFGIEAFYHSLTDLGFAIPSEIHGLVLPFLLGGMYCLTRTRLGGGGRSDDDDCSDLAAEDSDDSSEIGVRQ
ncbi:MAG: hypothetical protein U0136_14555 [Bdellovibrionota bacterium]